MTNECKHNFQTVWLSDLHLGTSACQVDELLEFLKVIDCNYMFLVGDIIDIWAIKSGSKWTAKHNTVIQKLLRKARQGTKIIFIPGNHDEAIRDYCGMTFGDIQVLKDYTYKLKCGKTVFITHGDEFDIVSKHHKWIAKLGDFSYSFLLKLNKVIKFVRRLLKLDGHFSLSQFIKYKVKQAVSFISDYENSVAEFAQSLHVDGIVTGHIHHAEMRKIGNIDYYNCGDGVESCTALVETMDGEMKIVKWGTL